MEEKMDKNNKSPFVEGLIIDTKRRFDHVGQCKNKAIVNMKDYKIENDELFLISKKEVETEDFIKVFTKNLRILFDLTPAAIKLFCYLATEVKYEDKVYLNKVECLEYTGFKKSTLFKAIKELKENNIIADTNAVSWYYINPAIFYKGSRISLIEQYVDKEMEKFKKESDKQSYFEKALRKFMIEWSNNKEDE